MVGTRTQWYRSMAIGWAWYEAAWRDDRKFTYEDIDETILAAAALAFVWKGNIVLAAVPGLAIVEGIVVTGAVVSYAIGGTEGVENYIDFITEPTKIPERIAFTAETIYEEKIKPEYQEKKGEVNLFLNFMQRLIDRQLRRTMPGYPLLPF